jgi:hypothetical protein
MDRTLRELERAFLERVISRRELFRRAAFLLAGRTAAFELLGRLSPRRVAWASPGCITLDLSTSDLASQGYTRDGNQPFSVDTAARRLAINDESVTDRCFLFKACPDIPTNEITVDVLMKIGPNGFAPSGENTGVHVVLAEGNGTNGITGREIRVACLQVGIERRLALQASNGTYTPGILHDWLIEQQFQIRRSAFGEATLESGALSDSLSHDRLAPTTFDTATFGLGCALNEAKAVPTFGPIGDPEPAQITPTLVQLFPNGAEKVAVEGTFAIDATSNGIDPAAEDVALRLHFPAGNRIYPVDGTDTMPVAFEPMSGGWRITAAGKQRTGIQDFEIFMTGDPSVFVFKLVDTKTGLPSADYHTVRLALEIGDDSGSVDMAPVENNGKWTLA